MGVNTIVLAGTYGLSRGQRRWFGGSMYPGGLLLLFLCVFLLFFLWLYCCCVIPSARCGDYISPVC